MQNNIGQTLTQQFLKQRIIIWYDSKRELREEFGAVWLPGVKKVEIENNQFSLKYQMLRQEPHERFLLYHDGPPPEDLDNWLLDVELAHGVFLEGSLAEFRVEI